MCTYVGLPPQSKSISTPLKENDSMDGRGGKKNEGRVKIFERIDSKILIEEEKEFRDLNAGRNL